MLKPVGKAIENMQILNTWLAWLLWLHNEPLFELKELPKEEKKDNNVLIITLKKLRRYRLLPFLKTSFWNIQSYNDFSQRQPVSWWLKFGMDTVLIPSQGSSMMTNTITKINWLKWKVVTTHTHTIHRHIYKISLCISDRFLLDL